MVGLVRGVAELGSGHAMLLQVWCCVTVHSITSHIRAGTQPRLLDSTEDRSLTPTQSER